MAYAALLFYIVVLFLRPQEWVPLIIGWPLGDIAVGLAAVTWLGSLMRSRWHPREAPQNGLMLGLLLAVLLSHAQHFYFAGVVGAFESFGKVVLVYVLIASVAGSLKRARGLVTVMVLGCLFMATHAVLQAWTGYGFGPRLEYYQPIVSEGVVRVRGLGIFNDPNDLALILVAMLPFLFRKIIGKDSSPPARVLSAGAAGWMLYAILLTNSRGGWLALAVMCAAFAAVHLQGSRGRKLAIAAGLVLFAGAIVLAPGRMGQYDTNDPAARGRWAAWGAGMAMLKSSPLFGVGYGHFMDFEDSGKVAHNSFVQCYGELGLFGYYFFVGLVMVSLMDGYAMTRLRPGGPDAAGEAQPPPDGTDANAGGPPGGGASEAGEDAVVPDDAATPQELRGFARALVPALSGFLAAGFFLSRTYVVPLYVLFALSAVLRTELKRSGCKPPGLFERRHLKWVFAAELASIVAIHTITRVLW